MQPKITCWLGKDLLKISRDLLLKNDCESFSDEITFPQEISLGDLQLYTNFLHSGYLNVKSLEAVVRVLKVADFLRQYVLCKSLLEGALMNSVNVEDIKGLLADIQGISPEMKMRIVEGCLRVIEEIVERDGVDAIPEGFLQDLYENVMEGGEKEAILECLLRVCGCQSYLELAEVERKRVESSGVIPEVEFIWKVSPGEHEQTECESDVFELREIEMNLKLVKSENLELYIKSIGCEEVKGLSRGLIMYQGESTHFYYFTGGSLEKLSSTSQKTKAFAVKLVIKSEELLYDIFLKASQEVKNGISLQNISSTTMKLILACLKSSISEESTLDIAAAYYSLNPSEQETSILEDSFWASKDPQSLSTFFQKHPKLRQLRSTFSRNHSEVNDFFQSSSTNTGNIITFQGEQSCQPLSPSGNPFVLDISDIITAPTTEKKFFKAKNRCSSLFDSENEREPVSCVEKPEEGICKYTKLCMNYYLPSKYLRVPQRNTALEQIRDLRRKVSSVKPERNRWSVAQSMYCLFDKPLKAHY